MGILTAETQGAVRMAVDHQGAHETIADEDTASTAFELEGHWIVELDTPQEFLGGCLLGQGLGLGGGGFCGELTGDGVSEDGGAG